MLRAPNPLLANGETVTVVHQNDAVGLRGGVTQTAGTATSYPAIATKLGASTRRDGVDVGAPTGVQLWDVLIFAATDPGVQLDDTLTTGVRILKATGPSYPRGTGAYQVQCQEIR